MRELALRLKARWEAFSFNSLDLTLTSKTESVEEGEETEFTLNIANAIWGQSGYEFLPEFLEVLSRNYGAGMRLVDFVNASEQARTTINDWIAEQTEDKIQDLIPEGVLDDLTRLVLTNAIYFKAGWLNQFDENLTRSETFYLLDGSTVQAEMMRASDPEYFNYAKGDGYQAIELLYQGDTTSMLILVPDEGRLIEVESKLDDGFIDKILDDMQPTTLALSLPKFSFESKFELANLLAEMGMPDAFDPVKADFSGMDGTDLLYISNVIHQAFVGVDEQGTEAAAATAVVMRLESAMIPELELTIDRPFIFLIRDQPTETILFVGRVLNPSR
jgi:serpin B